MKTSNKALILDRGMCGLLIVGVACLILLGHAVAAPVVDTPTPLTQQDDATKTKAATRSAVAPRSDATTQQQQQQQQYTPLPEGYQPAPVPQAGPSMMPLPPTYAPGSPGAAQGGSGMDPYGAMPTAPTAFGLYDSAHPGAGGGFTPGPTVGGPSTGGGQGMGQGMGTNLGFGYGVPPSPTPTSSLGGAAMADPSFGRYESQSISQATAPRAPATYGQTQSQVLSPSKPFQGYRPQSAYSPYMRLNQRDSFTGASNPYYEYVKPLLDQQQENRQVDRQIGGLQGVARSGFQNMESLRQRPGNTVQQAAPRNPATFMNTGQYYPGMGR